MEKVHKIKKIDLEIGVTGHEKIFQVHIGLCSKVNLTTNKNVTMVTQTQFIISLLVKGNIRFNMFHRLIYCALLKDTFIGIHPNNNLCSWADHIRF